MKTTAVTAAVVAAIALGASAAIGAENFSEASIDALNAVFGKHAGARASHAKGVCASGSFVATADAAKFSKAQIFSGAETKAEIRFSVGGGNPNVSDKAPAVRGLAVRFQTGYVATDLVMISAPMCFASTPESFLSFLAARVPDPQTKKPDPEKVKAHSERFPEGKAQSEYLAKNAPPRSYATSRFWSNHAFKFVDADGKARFGRYVVEPVAGVVGITDEEKTSLPDDFLAAELRERVGKAPAEFDVYVQLAEGDDSLINSAVVWPESRERVNLGRLKVTTVDMNQPGVCDGTMFNPTNLPPGIEASEDPILKARAGAYAVSLGRRQAK